MIQDRTSEFSKAFIELTLGLRCIEGTGGPSSEYEELYPVFFFVFFVFFLIKPRSRLGGLLLCLRFFFFLSVTNPKPPWMMSLSANYRPFVSSFLHIPLLRVLQS